MPTPDFSFRLVPLTLWLMEERGVTAKNRALLLEELPEGAATAEVVTAPLEAIQRFLARCEAAACIPSLGVELAAAAPRGTYQWVELVAGMSSTLEEAFVSIGRFARYANRGAHIAFVDRGLSAGLEISVQGSSDGWGRQLNEYTVAMFHRATAELAPGWRTERAWFSHEAPGQASIDALTTFLGATPSFGAGTCGFEGPAELLALPLAGAEIALPETVPQPDASPPMLDGLHLKGPEIRN